MTSRWIFLTMRNVSDESWRENQNTHFTFSNLFTNVSKFLFIVINLILWTFYVGEAPISPVFMSTIGLGCSVLNLCPEDARFQYRRSTGILISCSVVFLTTGKWRYFRLHHHSILSKMKPRIPYQLSRRNSTGKQIPFILQLIAICFHIYTRATIG
jgi:hypothetical protein